MVACAGQHDVAGLLAAQREPARAQLLQHVAVADLGGRTAIPASRMARCSRGCSSRWRRACRATSSPVVVHGRRASTAMIWSPSTTAPAASTARQRSASPSWAMPRSAPCSTHRAAAAAPRWVDPTPSLMLSPSGSACDRDDLGARPAVGLAARRPDAAPCAQSTTTRMPASGSGVRGEQVLDVALGGVRAGRGPGRWPRRSGRGAGGVEAAPRSPSSTRVGQLVAAGGEQLDAVVRHRVVRGGDHHAEVGVELADQVRDGRGRQHTDPDRVGAGGGEPGDDGGLEHLAAGAGVAADHGDRTVGPVALGQHARGGRGQTATASSGVRSSPLARPRTPSVPNRRRIAAKVSACCTGAPCGPS